jgi:quercetin dioxygenase-like cupin family protein
LVTGDVRGARRIVSSWAALTLSRGIRRGGKPCVAQERPDAGTEGNGMPKPMFDESNITWRTLDWLPHISFFVYKVDEENRIVDVVFKFAANQRVMLHRHKSPYVTLVMQGELRFYRQDGTHKETRPTGSYVSGVANGEPHLEGGGDEDAIVFFSNRNIEDALYEFLDDAGNPVQVLGIADFKAQLEEQVATGTYEKVTARAA